MTTATKTKNKISIAAQMVEQILTEGKKPQSIDQIKSKHQLDFPFCIKRVVLSNCPFHDCGCPNPTDGIGKIIEIYRIHWR